MTGRIIPFPGMNIAVPAALIDRGADEQAKGVSKEAVEMIEGVLQRLKDGRSVAVAVVEVHDNAAVATAWSPSDSHYAHLMAGAARLAARLAND